MVLLTASAGAGILLPQFNSEDMFNEIEDWTQITRNVRWYAARLGVIGSVVLATLLSALGSGASLILGHF